MIINRYNLKQKYKGIFMLLKGNMTNFLGLFMKKWSKGNVIFYLCCCNEDSEHCCDELNDGIDVEYDLTLSDLNTNITSTQEGGTLTLNKEY